MREISIDQKNSFREIIKAHLSTNPTSALTLPLAKVYEYLGFENCSFCFTIVKRNFVKDQDYSLVSSISKPRFAHVSIDTLTKLCQRLKKGNGPECLDIINEIIIQPRDETVPTPTVVESTDSQSETTLE